MRVKVAGPVEAHKGQLVRFYLRLKEDQQVGFCELFSSVGDYEPSPHVQLGKLDVKKDGKPVMVAPSTLRLVSGYREEVLLEIVAEEPVKFYLMQDIDGRGLPVVHAWGMAYGKWRERALSAIRRILGNQEWPIRGQHGEVHRIK